MYKLSYYNFYIPVKETDECLIYNSLNHKLFATSLEIGNRLKEWDQQPDISNKGNIKLNDDIKHELLSEGFLIPQHTNEKEILKTRWERARQAQSNRLYLVILPSNSCNMNCLYCFEGDSKPTTKMKDHTIDQIIDFLEEAIANETPNINELSVIWFGGEPLLYPKGIDKLSQKFIAFSKKHKLKYGGRLFTNGYLLNKGNWKILQQSKIDTIDVTIDGNKEMHSKNRPLKSGKDSYHQILKNLTHLPPGIQVLIRINIDKKVYEKIEEFLDDLNAHELWPKKHPHISLYLGFKRYYEFNGQKLNKSDFYTGEEFAQIKEDFRELKQAHYNKWAAKNNIRRAKLAWRFPEMNPFFCETVNSPYAFVINADGDIGKCWNHSLDKERMKFHVEEGFKAISNKKEFNHFCSFLQPEHDEVCRNCKHLPICDKGFCYDYHIEECLPRPCTTWKYNLENVLKKQYLLSIEQPDQIQSLEKLCLTYENNENK